MSEEKCCCNCLHCARWQTSKGIECHCDLTDRYLGYLEVMDTDNDCCKWEKETKWDEEKKHDAKIRAEAIEECIDALDYCVTVSECQSALRELKERIDV